MRSGLIKIIAAVSAVVAIIYFLKRDLWLESVYTYDFKNRQVGARIQKDNGLPYFYIWKQGDTSRYYDYYTNTNYSNITATPFFHHLIYPLADISHRKASFIWLIIEYLSLMICIGIAFYFSRTFVQRFAIFTCAVVFLLTVGWKYHIAAGQYYIIIPALFSVFLFVINRRKTNLNALAAGALVMMLVFIRPNTIFFFLPFIFLFKQFGLRYIISALVPSVVMFLFILSNQYEKSLWNNYSEGMKKQLRYHSHPELPFVKLDSIHRYAAADGWDSITVRNDPRENIINRYSENGNFFVIAEKLTGKRPGNNLLAAMMIFAAIGFVLIILIRHKKEKSISPEQMFLAGCCLYMIVDLLSPVYRHQYYIVQWLSPISIVAALYNRNIRTWFLVVFAGLLLNIVNLSWMKMEHTLGEYLILFSLLMITFRSKPLISK
ncbi:hypothetical protein [Pollutibacter soli]|uniref:hypothetical protein n=1 Tax=Pollutibacter soli TaxID=3034157 RepID=UPI003013CEFE